MKMAGAWLIERLWLISSSCYQCIPAMLHSSNSDIDSTSLR